MKLTILALALLVASCYAIEIPPFGINLPPFSGGGSISTPSSSINFDPNAIRVVTCTSIQDYFMFSSVEVGNNAVSTLQFQVHTGAGGGITGSFASVNSDSQNVAVFVIVSAYDTLEEINTAGQVVTTHTLDFSAASGASSNCSAAGQNVYNVAIESAAGDATVTVSCTVVAKPTTVDGLELTPNRMKCDVTIAGYTYAAATNKLRIIGRVGYNSASVSAGGLTSACAYSNGDNFCIRSAGGMAAYVSFDGQLRTGATFSGTATVETILAGAAQSNSFSGYTGINSGSTVQFLFNAAGESNIFWDPEIGVTAATHGFAATVVPSVLLVLFAVVAAFLF